MENEPQKKPIEKAETTEADKLIQLVETLVFTFVIVLVIMRIIGCCEMYNILENHR